MKDFNHINVDSAAKAAAVLSEGKTMMIAGGTDVIPLLKDNILPVYPETLVNIKTIPGLDYIIEKGGILKIGAGTRLSDIAEHRIINKKYTALAQAAVSAATPHIREMGTIAGNICQLPRCWYFRKPENRFNCIRKGGDKCFAATGDNRYHSIFEAVDQCITAHPSDIAPALIAHDAKIITTKRTINAEDIWDVGVPGNTILASDEIITEIRLPKPGTGAKSIFLKFALRKSIDFAIVNCAVSVSKDTARICLNSVAPKPYRSLKAEAAIAGKQINKKNAEEAGAAAVADARPVPDSSYKVQIAKTLVKRALLAIVKT